jgi:hypothetical protein
MVSMPDLSNLSPQPHVVIVPVDGSFLGLPRGLPGCGIISFI